MVTLTIGTTQLIQYLDGNLLGSAYIYMVATHEASGALPTKLGPRRSKKK
jgi:hypothetical protein